MASDYGLIFSSYTTPIEKLFYNSFFQNLMMSLLEYIGNTPHVIVDGVFVKLEHLNPSGSTKDRIAKHILEQAEKNGVLRRGMEVVEATSGNSGIAFALVCAMKGYKMNVIMPKGLTTERTHYLKAYNANILFTPKTQGVRGAVKKERELLAHKKYFCVRQFRNEWNVDAHRLTLGKEIVENHRGKVDAFVAGVGTGGTLIGVGQALRNRYPNVKLYAVEPAESPVLKGGKPGNHRIEGIGDGFVPAIYDNHRNMVDDVLTIRSKDAISESKKLARKGFLVGISSGANLLAAKKLKRKHKNIVTVFPDGGERYFSMGKH